MKPNQTNTRPEFPESSQASDLVVFIVVFALSILAAVLLEIFAATSGYRLGPFSS